MCQLSNFGEIWSNFGEIWSNINKNHQNLTRFHQNLTRFHQNWGERLDFLSGTLISLIRLTSDFLNPAPVYNLVSSAEILVAF